MECEALLCSICATESPFCKLLSPLPLGSKGRGRIGDHNLPDALYTPCTHRDSAGKSNSLKECTTCYTLHTTSDNLAKHLENTSALKVRNTRFLRGWECELKQPKPELGLMPFYSHKSKTWKVTYSIFLT